MKIKKSRIVAADDDFDFGDPAEDRPDPDDFDQDDLGDSIDDMQDTLEDMEDNIDEITEDDENIETDNNISNHYIAECEKCHGIFISAVIESDEPVESIHGKCPLCDKDSEQFLKWVVKDA